MRAKAVGDRRDEVQENDRHLNKCPECGLIAVSRYWNAVTKVYVYKHTRFIEGKKGHSVKQRASYYHEALK